MDAAKVRQIWSEMSKEEKDNYANKLTDEQFNQLKLSLSSKDESGQAVAEKKEPVVPSGLEEFASGAVESVTHPAVALGTAGTVVGGPVGGLIGAGIGLVPDVLRGFGVPNVPDLHGQAKELLRSLNLTSRPTEENRYYRRAGEFASASAPGGLRGVASGVVSGLSSQAAQDAFPESPVAPVLGALAPTAASLGGQAAIRGLVRGTPSSAEMMRTNIAAQEAVGMPADTALARQGRASGILKYLSRAPGSVKQVAEKGKDIQSGLGAYLDDLTPAKTEPVAVGSLVQSGIDGFKKKAAVSWNKANSAFEKSIPQNTNVPLTNTASILDDLAGKVNDPAFKDVFPVPGQLDKLRAAVSNKGVVDFKTANEIRKAVGQKAADANLIADVSKGQWKALYGALSKDIKSSLNTGDRRALELFERTNKVWTNVNKRIDDIYGPLNNIGTPEAKYFASVRGLNQGATKLTAIRKIMPKEDFAKLRDTFLNDMGKATPGRQNEYGDLFSSERFLTNWSSLTDSAKISLIGKNTSLRGNLDLLAKQSSEIRKVDQVYQNPSGTGLAAGSIATGGLVVGATLSGNLGLAASVLGAMGVNYASAKALTNPKFAKFLADSTKVKPEKIPMLVNRFVLSMEKDGHSFDKEQLKKIEEEYGNKILNQ